MAVAGAIYLGFDRLEKISSHEIRRDLAGHLKRTDFVTLSTRLPKRTREFFESIFGKRHFTLRCFWRSIKLSVAALVTLAISGLIIYGGPWIDALLPQSNATLFETFQEKASIVALCVIAAWSLIVDYLNLFKTRLVIGFLERHEVTRIPGLSLVIAIDMAVAFVIFVFGLLAAMTIGEVWAVIENSVNAQPVPPTLGAWDMV